MAAMALPVSSSRGKNVILRKANGRLREGVSVRVLIVTTRARLQTLLALIFRQAAGVCARSITVPTLSEKAKARIPDCIVLDVAMPGLSGIGVAAAFRRMEATKTIPLLAYSAFDTADYSREMKEVGFYAIFRRPAELARLEGLIFGLVNRTAAGDFDLAQSNVVRIRTPAALDLANKSGVKK